MKVVVHPSPVALESLLVASVGEIKKKNPLTPVLVIVPTSRLAAALRRSLAQALGGYLALEVLPHRALSLRAACRDAVPAPRVASAVILGTLLDRLLARQPDNPWARFARRRPGARSALLSALTDLREAGLGTAEVGANLEDRDLAVLFEGWTEELERSARHGLVDEAGLVERALPRVADVVPAGAAVFHHGAYELIGVHLDLVRAVDAVATVSFLLPCAAEAPAYRYAERYARRHLLAADDELVAGESPATLAGLPAGRLSDLWNESAAWPELDGPPLVRFRHAQGAAAEAETAVRHGLEAARTGTPPEEIAFIARDTSSWSMAFEEALDDRGLPHTSSARHPLRRDPSVIDLLAALELVRDDFPRSSTAGWLASPRLVWKGLLPGGRAVRGGRADAWSRQAGLLGGLAEWTDDLTAWARAGVERASRATAAGESSRSTQKTLPFAEPAAPSGADKPGDWRQRRLEEVTRLGQALEALNRALEPARPRRWSTHADAVESLRDRLLPGDGDDNGAGEMLGKIFDDMRTLDASVEPGREVPYAEMVAWMVDAVGRSNARPREEDSGGFRVLDVRQARGLVFRHVLLVGLQSGQFPRTPREDPVLPDTERLRLRAASGRPVGVAAEADDEERLLFALALGSARERLDLSWQRADETGRSLLPSLALREVARVTLGEASLARVVEYSVRVAGHPLRGLEDALADPGLLAPDEELQLLALRESGPENAARPMLARCPELAQGLSMLAAVESFDPVAPVYDGRIGDDVAVPGAHSPTNLETLGRCPLQYFFKKILKVREPDTDVLPWQVDPRDLGVATHRLLETLYRRLVDERALDGDADSARRRARAILDEIWPEHVRQISRRQSARLPLLWEIERSRWHTAVEGFVDEDLFHIMDEAWRPVAFESDRRREVDLGEGASLALRGRFDRVLARGDELRVEDYKTGSAYRFGDKVATTKILRGEELQAALYRELAGGEATVDLLRIGLGDRGNSEDLESRCSFPGFADERHDDSFRETLRVLAGLLRERRFPMHPSNACTYCAYRLACRQEHAPSREREARAADTEAYRLVKRKDSRRRAFVDDLRAAGAPPDGGEEERS